MKPRSAGLLVVLIAATAACKGAEKAPTPSTGSQVVAAPAAGSGSAAHATADPWTEKAPEKDPLKRPLLWSIEKDGKTSYALGTMHLGIDPTSRLPDLVWQKLDAAPTFAMETNLADGAKLEVLRKDGTTLKQELGDEYWKKLEDALGVGEASRMLQFKPMIPATLLSKRGLPDTVAMDGVLHGRALNGKKKVVFLEPFSAQASVLLRWMNAQALKDMLDDVPGLEQRSKDMLAAYVAGDEVKIVAIADSERKNWLDKGHPETEYDEQMDDLLYKRNASWIEPIEKLHAEGGGFIAVGAMHLVGPRSVLELLAKKGYKVTRLTP
jgi:uncharacterized protein YbaP (TraB family)